MLLEEAIHQLYRTFAIYPFSSKMEGCPCCVSNEDKAKIHTKQLKALSGEDLGRYTFKAMTTWGEVNDFKHYLPRIMELLTRNDMPVDTFVILGKLSYAKWETWPEREQDVVRCFLLAWWENAIKHAENSDIDLLIEIQLLVKDIHQVLSLWKINFEDKSLFNFIEFVYYNYYDLVNNRKGFKAFSAEESNQIQNWIKSQSTKLEEAFFYFESKDKVFAQKISDTILIIEKS